MASLPIPSPVEPSPELRAALLQRIEQGLLELPLLPQAAQEVLGETNPDEADSRRLAEIIRRDAAMAAHVLRVANSPLFMPPSPIVSLQQAISRLGMSAIRRIALLIACQTRVFKVTGYDDEVRQLFRHSLAAAGFAQEIARLRRSNVEEAFLCGLLHDVGRPVILQALADLGAGAEAPGSRRRSLPTQPPPTPAPGMTIDPQAAHALADELHPRVGSALAGRWSLPPWLAEALAYHHDPQSAPRCGPLATTVAVADRVAHLALGTGGMTEEACRQDPLWAELNIYPDQVTALLSRSESVTAMVRSLA